MLQVLGRKIDARPARDMVRMENHIPPVIYMEDHIPKVTYWNKQIAYIEDKLQRKHDHIDNCLKTQIANATNKAEFQKMTAKRIADAKIARFKFSKDNAKIKYLTSIS